MSLGKVMLATVAGDIHDLGKNIVAALLENNGFEIVDLGKDVPVARIVAAALARDVLAQSWHTNFAVKRTLRDTDGMALDDALAFERAQNPGPAPDHAARVARFTRK